MMPAFFECPLSLSLQVTVQCILLVLQLNNSQTLRSGSPGSVAMVTSPACSSALTIGDQSTVHCMATTLPSSVPMTTPRRYP